ncbi:ATP synthase F1 subunit epsilon [Clostridium sp. MCC353]|uniref:ATP synthase F1 subunit epsilon n=1 Tax=Clostridium sp. MCC353 TaxID=2592646 RepID=UPI001C00B3F2|nr:ATP synthase F1 subunit epsilon [Clostridium sp. MCC353]MBT9780080.1 ATP synthase F1 subunit epsilon [Clostridium sp. MCC353]
MADMFKLQVITPDKKFYEGEVSMVELTTTEGQIGVYKNHIPMTAIVAPGVLSIHEADGVKRAALHAGFIQILPEQITIMAETVEWPDEIDINRAEEARVRAERRIKETNGEVDVMRAELAYKRALVRLTVAK